MTDVALITGGSRGLGAALAALAAFLAGQSYDLVITSRTAEELDATARALSRYGGRVIALAGDVVDATHRRQLVTVVESLGGLDLLVNNASELGPSPMPALADFPISALERVFAVNVLAPLALIQDLLPSLAQRRGLVVNVSSDAAVGGYAGWGGYGASKAGLDLISRTLGTELAERGVAVVSVDPGDMRTRMHQAAFPTESISDRPMPEATIPFWAWLLQQRHEAVSGRRYLAQGERWEAAA